MVDPVIQLTSAERDQSNYVPFSRSVRSADGISITFDFYAYGGTSLDNATGNVDSTIGGDGISFFFIDGAQLPSRIGGSGGSLGYAPRTSEAGLSGGYLAVGFDEFGNFSGPSEGRVGGPGRVQDSIAVRGSQGINYKYLDGTGFNELPISLDNPGSAATRANSKRTARIDLDSEGNLTVSLDLDLDGTIEANEKIIQLNVIDAGNGEMPDTFRFGFAASTGSATNIHEISNFRVTTSDGQPIIGGFVDSNIAISSQDRDILVGGPGADRFVFSGAGKRQALRTSTLQSLDVIQGFSFSHGDRIQLDYDNDLTTVLPSERPRRIFNAGKLKGGLKKAVKQAYADKNFKKRGDQALKSNEAVFFRIGKRAYLSLNDNKGSFSAKNDLVVDVSGIELKPGDLRKGSFTVSNYFSIDPIL